MGGGNRTGGFCPGLSGRRRRRLPARAGHDAIIIFLFFPVQNNFTVSFFIPFPFQVRCIASGRSACCSAHRTVHRRCGPAQTGARCCCCCLQLHHGSHTSPHPAPSTHKAPCRAFSSSLQSQKKGAPKPNNPDVYLEEEAGSFTAYVAQVRRWAAWQRGWHGRPPPTSTRRVAEGGTAPQSGQL